MGRASLQEAILNNVLTWFIQKMPESANFSENASFWSQTSPLTLRASEN